MRNEQVLADINRQMDQSPREERGARGVHTNSGPSPSRSDVMPTFFVVGLAVLSVFGFFGVISIGQFLAELARGK